MDLQIFRRNRSAHERELLDHRLESRDFGVSALRKEEMTDVFSRALREASGSPRFKELDINTRQNGILSEQNSRGAKPSYTSLADIYEGALRKVLNLELNLKIEEQPRFHDGNDITHPDKPSPPRPHALRLEDEKHREEYRHRRYKGEDENDSRIAPQGQNILRKLGERSTAEGSAFHVPSKRCYDASGFPSLERESEFQVEHYGTPRHPGPEFPMEYGRSHYHPHLYGTRMDPLRRARLAPSYMRPRSMVHESYSRYSSHQREIPPLFPVRCSSVERDGQTAMRETEHERIDYRRPDVTASLNGARASVPVFKYSNSKLGVVKIEREENDKLEEAFNKANDHLTQHKSPTSPRRSPDRKSPHSERFQPYSRRNRASTSPHIKISVEMNGDSSSCYKSLENTSTIKHEGKMANGEDGEKEEFLSNLGLARIF